MKNCFRKFGIVVAILLFYAIVAIDVAYSQTDPKPEPPPVLAVVTCDTTKDDCVEVPQSFVDDANAAFEIAVEQKKVIEKFLNERATTDAEREAAAVLIKGYDDFIRIHDSFVSTAEKLQKLQAAFIETQNQFIDKILKLLEQKNQRGFLGKLWSGFKQLATLVIAFYAGRGFGN